MLYIGKREKREERGGGKGAVVFYSVCRVGPKPSEGARAHVWG